MLQAVAHRAIDHQAERWLGISNLRCRDRWSRAVVMALSWGPWPRSKRRAERGPHSGDLVTRTELTEAAFCLGLAKVREMKIQSRPDAGRARSHARGSVASRSALKHPVSERRSMVRPWVLVPRGLRRARRATTFFQAGNSRACGIHTAA